MEAPGGVRVEDPWGPDSLLFGGRAGSQVLGAKRRNGDCLGSRNTKPQEWLRGANRFTALVPTDDVQWPLTPLQPQEITSQCKS